jgi:hypothetical protein
MTTTATASKPSPAAGVTVAALSIPPPAPPLPVPRQVRDDLPPEEAALQDMLAMKKGLPDDLVAEIAQCDQALARELEQARLHETDHDVAYWRTRATARLRQKAEWARLLALLGREAPAVDVPVGVLEFLTSVKRWRSGEGLRDAREATVKALREDLDTIRASRAFCERDYGAGTVHLGETPADVHRQLTGFIAEERRIVDLLAELDRDGDPGRAAGVQAAIERHGGLEKVAETLAPAQHAPAAIEAQVLAQGITGAERRLALLPDDTMAHAELKRQVEADRQRHGALLEQAEGQRLAAGCQLVRNALQGPSQALAKLQQHAAGRHEELAGDIARIRADRQLLAATVGAQIAQDDKKAEEERQRRR